MLLRWWIARRRSLRKLILLLGSIASIAALVAGLLPDSVTIPWWGFVLIIVSAVFIGLLIFLEFSEHPQRRVFRKGDTDGILKYMNGWIKDGGRVAIWTRDMSWADNEEAQHILHLKATRQELIIFLPTPTSLTQTLAQEGAEVFCYGSTGLASPSSRFTIAHFGRDGSSVAVGRARRGTHLIDEFHSGDHPAYHIAADLALLARSISDLER